MDEAEDLFEPPFVNLYAALFFNSSAPADAISRQAKLLSAACHPDRYPAPKFSDAQRETAASWFMAVRKAKEHLLDESEFADFRELYDLRWWRELRKYDEGWKQQTDAMPDLIRGICPAWKAPRVVKQAPTTLDISPQPQPTALFNVFFGLYIAFILLLILCVRPAKSKDSTDGNLVDLDLTDSVDHDESNRNRHAIQPLVGERGVDYLLPTPSSLEVPPQRKTKVPKTNVPAWITPSPTTLLTPSSMPMSTSISTPSLTLSSREVHTLTAQHAKRASPMSLLRLRTRVVGRRPMSQAQWEHQQLPQTPSPMLPDDEELVSTPSSSSSSFSDSSSQWTSTDSTITSPTTGHGSQGTAGHASSFRAFFSRKMLIYTTTFLVSIATCAAGYQWWYSNVHLPKLEEERKAQEELVMSILAFGQKGGE